MRCPNCNADNQSTAKFCVECGSALHTPCIKCGFKNPAVAKFCQECGSALKAGAHILDSPAASGEPGAFGQAPLWRHELSQGERKTVSALFADIKGSMELMENLDPDEARAIVDPALRLMIEAAQRYDGYVVQSTGDGIFALFGAPAAHEDHPLRALHAALRMQEDLNRYGDGLRAKGRSPLRVRVGVNTGEAVVRSLETHARVEYTPIGHSTGLAARMQTLARPGSVAVTEQTRKLCEGYFTFKSLGAVQVKGVSEPVNIYEATGLGPLRTRFQLSAERGLSRFVGRQDEIGQTIRALELARAGHGQIVAVQGEAGVGKSRLFYEFKAAAQAECLVLETFGLAHGKSSAYLPVIELLRNYFEIAVVDNKRRQREQRISKLLALNSGRVISPGRRRAREKMARKLRALDSTLEDTLPHLFTLLGIQDSSEPLGEIDGQVKRRRTQEALKRILLRESLNQPLVVIFEDLHWIDGETQSFLNLLADSIANARVLLLVNYRPEYRHEWSNKSYYAQVRLDPLGAKNAGEMLKSLLGDDDAVVTVSRLIIDKTEGNPFFIEEMVRALFEQGVLVRDGMVKLAKSLDDARLPPTVQGILTGRIDRLPAAEKELLQAIAVLGRKFPVSLIRGVTQLTEDQLERMLSVLRNGEFIYEQPALPEAEYTFKHALTQEVAYNSLLTQRRKLLHERAASAIESFYEDRLDDHVEELAHHYSRSENAGKALDYLLKAGENAAQRSASREALERFEAGLKLLAAMPASPARDRQELATRVAILWPLGEVEGPAAAEIESNLKRAEELCQKGETPTDLVFQVLHGLWIYYFFIARFELARTLADQIIAFGAQRGDEIASLTGHHHLGVTCATSTGEFRAATASLEKSIAIAERLLPGCTNPILRHVVSALVYGRVNLSWTLWTLGYPQQALHQIDLLYGLPKDVCAKFDTVTILSGDFTIRCRYLRDYRVGREKAEALIALSHENGFSHMETLGSVYLGHVIVHEGNVEQGIETILRGREAFRTAGYASNFHYCNGLLADAYLAAGRMREGLAIVEESIAAANQLTLRWLEAELHRLKGEFLAADGHVDEAEVAMRRAIDLAQRQEAKSWELRAATSLARLLQGQGKSEAARTILAGIYNWFTEGIDTADLKDAQAMLRKPGA
jgi:class 3 adenylate cyclase/tetratricopeptide (TPR) repeat protein